MHALRCVYVFHVRHVCNMHLLETLFLEMGQLCPAGSSVVWGTVPRTERLWVRSPAGAGAWAEGVMSDRGACGRQLTDASLSQIKSHILG